jgi:hypothetical protein
LSLGALAVVYERTGGAVGRVKDMWRLIAWLGRYGHQPASTCLDLSFDDLTRLSGGVSEIMRDEADALRSTDA